MFWFSLMISAPSSDFSKTSARPNKEPFRIIADKPKSYAAAISRGAEKYQDHELVAIGVHAPQSHLRKTSITFTEQRRHSR